ncbi:bifunctional protein FolD [Tepiditoga spiralis]|uniref:Bifunctional protein FolD n=1 Tax=Tepiditoga spiralis TaxID=2108365 RepID=A0A7G1GBR4_9BACT|nr:bifunctional 5,10-methylenetetrahydrofolate dehydrogenase/5,10-methenyltetrahydrofolate cyclohydrolase [Tepiditoga spiralis]BBE31912.1 bifunctional protein FolD [Tepiditoga spiralis]
MQNKLFSIKTIIDMFDKPIFKKNIELYKNNNINPKIVCIITSDDLGSLSYSKGINNICKEFNIDFENFYAYSRHELTDIINSCNKNESINGIITLYPIDFGKDTHFMNLVSFEKDIEGLNNKYLGYLMQHEKFQDEYGLRKLIIPPTAKGILYVLKRYNRIFESHMKTFGKYPDTVKENPFNLNGKKVTIINDSLAVGRSLALMFLNENASVRVCQKYTDYKDILNFVSNSDIIISAVPSKKFIIPTNSIKENSIIFDVSFTGNFEYPSIYEKVYKISPMWKLVKKGNRINDMTLHRLISNLFYLTNRNLPEKDLIELKNFENSIIPKKEMD